MKAILAAGAVLALIASLFVLRIVLHGYTHHSRIDYFHLAVGVVSAGLATVFALRAMPRRPAS
jgi:hypothetical protein